MTQNKDQPEKESIQTNSSTNQNDEPSQNFQRVETPGGTLPLVEIIDIVAERVDPIIELVKTFAKEKQESVKAEAKFKISMAWVAVVVVGLILSGATFLTYVGKMDGSTYGFLLGLIVGYALTFIRDAIGPGSNE